ncbi:MAG: tRNA-dihydrouridine synthase family protein [Candidatus Bilamarchaeaceae archaeon]
MRLPKNFLAPISEYTNLPFRLLCQKYGASATVVPLVNVTAIAKRKEGIDKIQISDKEKFVGVQLFGSNPTEFKIASHVLLASFPFIKWFDINCGCPMDNIIRVGAGAALLKKPKKIVEIISSLYHTDLPISVKMRILENEKKTICFCKKIEQGGADFLVVHGRTPTQLYSGKANWDIIKKISNEINVPVVGNGDIANVADGLGRVRDGFCASFMIGRAAMKNPLCFKNKKPNGIKGQKRIFLEYFSFCEKVGYINITDLRQKALFIFRGCDNCSSIRFKISQAKSVEDLLGFVKSL